MNAPRWLLLSLAPLVMVGCQRGGDGSKEKVYDVKARVVAVDVGQKTVTLDHEDIPGLMKAMQMKFSVENPKILEGLQPGDPVEGKLKVQSGGNPVVTELHKR